MTNMRKVNTAVIGLVILAIIGVGQSLLIRRLDLKIPLLNRIALASADHLFANNLSNLYLPVVIQNNPHRSVFGVELYNVLDYSGAVQMDQAGAYWIRRNGLLWSDVEVIRGVRDWSKVDGLARDMKNATSRSMTVVLVVRGAPSWAADRSCGPVYHDRFSEFGSFLAEAVSRFSQPPYNVLYYEIWNEPDIDPSMVKPDALFGCWGDKNDPTYGGKTYGEMLRIVYPMMKAANPDVQVLVGGLLLDCDPAIASSCSGDPKSALFLDGVLQSAPSSFDGVAFHAYDYIGAPGAIGQFANLNWGAYWNNDVGPVVNAKAFYVQNLLIKYQVTGKYLMNSESALINLPDNCSDCEDTKAYYLAQSFAFAIRQKLKANIWYSFFGWRGSGLATNDLSTLPAYTAFDIAREQLADAIFTQEIGIYPNVKALSFSRGNQTIWLIWSRDGINHPIILPKIPDEILSVYGAPSTPVSQNFLVTIQPTYLIFSP